MSSDKRRKRPVMAATASLTASAGRDFHVVTIDESAGSAPRRRSVSAGRSDSWMNKVTSAMSTRLFAGRRLSGSRSTQVMPMLHGGEQIGASKDSENDGEMDGGRAKKPLRQVASEVALPRPSPELNGAAKAAYSGDGVSTPILLYKAASDEGVVNSFNSDTVITVTHVTSTRMDTIQVRTPQRREQQGASMRVEKVYPRSGHRHDDDDDDAVAPQVRRSSLHQQIYESDKDERSVEAAAPILKDFFTRSAVGTQRERVQQRESRREQHYKASRQRHERLRTLHEREDHDREQQAQQSRIAQLRRSQQRRQLRLKAEASRLKRYVEATEDSQQSRYEREREQWEQEFGEEMRILSDAYRKTCRQESDAARPMTVAGAVVAEAVSVIQRDALDTRRVHTAGAVPTPQPYRWSQEEFDRVLSVEKASNIEYDVGESQGGEDADEPQTMQRLRRENVAMARRIAELEKLAIDSKQAVVVQGMGAKLLENGFFI